MSRKIIDLGFCPRCKEDLDGMMTGILGGVKFCYLCSCDLEENHIERETWIRWAKVRAKEGD